ncbi:MAG: phosphoribosylanthranilate isomerase [Candidatus Pacebacteria bacterium]|nr:phosphoribosylanthranilate isomerase [Candidatus Paceibacterota bacterium]
MATRVKICGLTNIKDARHAVACGADYLGFVLVPSSPRYVSAEGVAAIIADLPEGIPKVGVFVNRPLRDIELILQSTGLTIAQLHGDESVSVVRQLGTERTWKSCTLMTAGDVEAVVDFPADVLLVDSAVDGRVGGTGRVGNWPLAAELAARRKIFLAGGLNPSNVADAVRSVHPFGVDVSSGVEQSPGSKDPEATKAFIDAVRGVG